MNTKNRKKIIILILSIFLLTGCTKTLKDEDKNVVTNKETGQSITENIICKPTSENVIEIYEKQNKRKKQPIHFP